MFQDRAEGADADKMRSWPTRSTDSWDGLRDDDISLGLGLKEYRYTTQLPRSKVANAGRCHTQLPITEDNTLHRRWRYESVLE